MLLMTRVVSRSPFFITLLSSPLDVKLGHLKPADAIGGRTPAVNIEEKISESQLVCEVVVVVVVGTLSPAATRHAAPSTTTKGPPRDHQGQGSSSKLDALLLLYIINTFTVVPRRWTSHTAAYYFSGSGT